MLIVQMNDAKMGMQIHYLSTHHHLYTPTHDLSLFSYFICPKVKNIHIHPLMEIPPHDDSSGADFGDEACIIAMRLGR